jgi:hypothetical protein
MDGKVPGRPDLSPQENKVLRLMAEGLSTRDLAEELKISEPTASGLMREIYKKLSQPPDTDEPRARMSEDLRMAPQAAQARAAMSGRKLEGRLTSGYTGPTKRACSCSRATPISYRNSWPKPSCGRRRSREPLTSRARTVTGRRLPRCCYLGDVMPCRGRRPKSQGMFIAHPPQRLRPSGPIQSAPAVRLDLTSRLRSPGHDWLSAQDCVALHLTTNLAEV